MNFLKSASVTFITQIFLLPISMVSGIVLARALGPSGRGIYAMVFLVPNMIMTFISLGTASSLIYLLGKKKYDIEKLIGYAIFLSLSLGFIGIALFWFIYPIIQPSLNDVSPRFLIISVMSVPFLLINSYLSGILLSLGKAVAFNAIKILETILMLIGILVIWLITDVKVIHVVWITFINTFVVSLLFIFQIKKHSKIQIYFSKPLVKDSLSFGLKMYLNGLLSTLSYRVDMFIIGYLLTSLELGYYSVAVSWSEMLWMLTNAVTIVFFPKISSSTISEANNITPLVSRNLLLISLPMGFLLAIGATILGPIFYGTEFIPAIVPMYWLLPGVWVFSIVKILSSDISGRGRPELNLLPLGIATITNVPLNFYLVPLIGLNGVPVSSTLSYFLSSLIILVIFRKLSGVPIRKVLFPERSDWLFYKVQLLAGTRRIKNLLIRNSHNSS